MVNLFHNISGVHEFVITESRIIYIFLTDITCELEVRVIVSSSDTYADIRIVHRQKNDERLVLRTLQQHTAPRSSSSVLVKGVLRDHAQLTYAGNIYVDRRACQTQASQKSHTLVVSPTAHAQAVPALEVLTNDVQCKHGSAIAGLSEQALEYLASRGIARNDAHELLVTSFYLAALEDQKARDYFIKTVT